MVDSIINPDGAFPLTKFVAIPKWIQMVCHWVWFSMVFLSPAGDTKYPNRVLPSEANEEIQHYQPGFQVSRVVFHAYGVGTMVLHGLHLSL